MNTFQYSAISKTGERISGLMEGFNQMDAATKLKESCDIILKLDPVKEKTGLLSMEIGGKKLNAKAFTVMCNQFAIILKAGIPIGRTVQLIADKTADKLLKKMLRAIAEDVEAGHSLADSFAERGGDFLPVTFIETIRAGEASGNLEGSFASMSVHFEKQTKMRSKVRSALAYPAFIMVVAVVVVVVMMIVVVPRFTSTFEDLGGELPWMTKVLIAVSDFFRKYIFYLIGAVTALFLVYRIYKNTEDGRVKTAQFSLQLPVIGNIGVLNAASQFSNSLASMLAAGLPLARAISITANTMDNYYLSQEVGKLAIKLEEGQTLGSSMRAAGIMPDILTDMVGVGEETGEMQHTMEMISGYYDAELEQATTSAVGKLGPAVLMFVAAVVGFIVLAVYMAMFSIYDLM